MEYFKGLNEDEEAAVYAEFILVVFAHDYQRVYNWWQIGEIKEGQHQGVFNLDIKQFLLKYVGDVHNYLILVLQPVEYLPNFMLVTSKSLNQIIQLVPLSSQLHGELTKVLHRGETQNHLFKPLVAAKNSKNLKCDCSNACSNQVVGMIVELYCLLIKWEAFGLVVIVEEKVFRILCKI